jgi:hypothetical protein
MATLQFGCTACGKGQIFKQEWSNKLSVLPCGHFYHSRCLKTNFEGGHICVSCETFVGGKARRIYLQYPEIFRSAIEPDEVISTQPIYTVEDETENYYDVFSQLTKVKAKFLEIKPEFDAQNASLVHFLSSLKSLNPSISTEARNISEISKRSDAVKADMKILQQEIAVFQRSDLMKRTYYAIFRFHEKSLHCTEETEICTSLDVDLTQLDDVQEFLALLLAALDVVKHEAHKKSQERQKKVAKEYQLEFEVKDLSTELMKRTERLRIREKENIQENFQQHMIKKKRKVVTDETEMSFLGKDTLKKFSIAGPAPAAVDDLLQRRVDKGTQFFRNNIL